MELHNKTGSTQPRSDSAANVSPEDSQSPASKERAVTQTLQERFSLRGDRQQRRLSQVQQPQKLEDVAEAQMEGSSKKGKVWKQQFLPARLSLTYKWRQWRRWISHNKLCISPIMRWLCGELQSQETHVESPSGLEKWEDTKFITWWCLRSTTEGHGDILANCAFIYKTMKRLTAAAATSEYQSFVDTSFLRYKISRSVAKRRKAECPTGGGEQCAEDFEVEKRERAPLNQRTLVWHGRLQLQVKSKQEVGNDDFLNYQILEFKKKQKKEKKEYTRKPAKTASSRFTMLVWVVTTRK